MTDPQHTIDADADGQPDYATDAAADARQRALRTLLQGGAVAVLLAVLTVLVAAFSTAQSWADIDWRTLSFLAVQAVLTAAASYASRLLVPPTEASRG